MRECVIMCIQTITESQTNTQTLKKAPKKWMNVIDFNVKQKIGLAQINSLHAVHKEERRSGCKLL